MQRWPTSVCTAYAKSTGVEPDGSAITSPLGVKTKTSREPRSKRSDSRNSPGSWVSRCQSSSCRSQSRSSLPGVPETATSFLVSLYFQCAAMPYSAVRCIPIVRICSSTGLPSGPITVVCSDWYMLNFGIAM